MSLPVNRDTVESIMRDMLNRIRALEAKRPVATGGGFGESITVLADTVTQDDPIVWDTPECDPHTFWSAGTPDRFTIPTGLGGMYVFSWTIDDEDSTSIGAQWSLQRDACPWIGSSVLGPIGNATRQTYTFMGNVDEGMFVELVPIHDPMGAVFKWFVMTRVSDEYCYDQDSCE